MAGAAGNPSQLSQTVRDMHALLYDYIMYKIGYPERFLSLEESPERGTTPHIIFSGSVPQEKRDKLAWCIAPFPMQMNWEDTPAILRFPHEEGALKPIINAIKQDTDFQFHLHQKAEELDLIADAAFDIATAIGDLNRQAGALQAQADALLRGARGKTRDFVARYLEEHEKAPGAGHAH